MQDKRETRAKAHQEAVLEWKAWREDQLRKIQRLRQMIQERELPEEQAPQDVIRAVYSLVGTC